MRGATSKKQAKTFPSLQMFVALTWRFMVGFANSPACQPCSSLLLKAVYVVQRRGTSGFGGRAGFQRKGILISVLVFGCFGVLVCWCARREEDCRIRSVLSALKGEEEKTKVAKEDPWTLDLRF